MKITRTKVDNFAKSLSSVALIVAGTAGLIFHIKHVVENKSYGLFDGICDIFAVDIIADGVRGIGNAIVASNAEQDPALIPAPATNLNIDPK